MLKVIQILNTSRISISNVLERCQSANRKDSSFGEPEETLLVCLLYVSSLDTVDRRSHARALSVSGLSQLM